MPSPDLAPLSPRGLQRNAGLLALAISLALHGGALAGLVLLRQPAPPQTIAVTTVALVSAGPVAAIEITAAEVTAAEVTAVGGSSALGQVSAPPSPANVVRAPQASDARPAIQALAVPAAEPRPVQRPGPERPEAPSGQPKAGSSRSSSVDVSLAVEEQSVAQPPAPRRKPRNAALTGERLPTDRVPIGRALSDGGGAGSGGRPDAPHPDAQPPEDQPKYSGGGLSNAPPPYPYLARRRGQEGRVVLLVQVSAAGDALAVRLRDSSGHRLLDQAALEAVKAWRFIPASRLGRPVAGSVAVPVSFKLAD